MASLNHSELRKTYMQKKLMIFMYFCRASISIKSRTSHYVHIQMALNTGEFFIPPLNKVEGGILVSPCPSVHPSVRLSVCGQNGVHSVSSTILAGSISYSHILSSNFRRCVTCKVLFKINEFEVLGNSLNL